MIVGENVEKRVDIGLAKDGSGVGGKSLGSRFLSRPHTYIFIVTSGSVCPAIPEAGQDTEKEGDVRRCEQLGGPGRGGQATMLTCQNANKKRVGLIGDCVS